MVGATERTLSKTFRMTGFIAIPKTMDNDVTGTDYCIGFPTAVTRSVNFIHALRTSSGSHERIAVVELFGRMVALSQGRYKAVEIEVVSGGAKRVGVAGLYDAETYRPCIRSVEAKPMFLY